VVGYRIYSDRTRTRKGLKVLRNDTSPALAGERIPCLGWRKEASRSGRPEILEAVLRE